MHAVRGFIAQFGVLHETESAKHFKLIGSEISFSTAFGSKFWNSRKKNDSFNRFIFNCIKVYDKNKLKKRKFWSDPNPTLVSSKLTHQRVF